MDQIFFVSSTMGNEYSCHSLRWFSKFEDAERFVLENVDNWIEGYIRFAVIETVREGFPVAERNPKWYAVDPDTAEIAACDEPHFARNKSDWWSGG